MLKPFSVFLLHLEQYPLFTRPYMIWSLLTSLTSTPVTPCFLINSSHNFLFVLRTYQEQFCMRAFVPTIPAALNSLSPDLHLADFLFVGSWLKCHLVNDSFMTT